MKSIREIQYDNAMISYVNLLRIYSETPAMSTIEKILSNVEYSTDRMPMCGNYRLEPYVKINDRYLNSELELIRADSNTIVTFLSQVERYLRTLEYVAATWCKLAKKTVNRVRENLFTYTSDVISASTEILSLPDVIDTNVTTMMYQNGMIVPNQTSATACTPVFVDHDIVIKPTSGLSTNTITGSKTSIFNPSEYGNLVLDAETDDIIECGFVITATKAIAQVNTAIIEFVSNTKGVRILMEISTDGRSYTTVYDKVCWDVRAVIPFGSTSDISAVRTTMTTNVPTVVSDTSVLMEFKLHKISFVNIKNALSNVFQTKRIPVDKDVKLIAPVVDATISNATMNVKIAADADGSDNAVGFVSVKSLPDGVMRLDAKTSAITITNSTDMWALNYDTEYSAKLYNLFTALEANSVNNTDFSITDSKLKLASINDSIIPSSITLKRGMRDFLKSEMLISSDHSISNILHSTEYVATTKWFTAIDLKATWNEVIPASAISSVNGSYNNAFLVTYSVENPDSVQVYKEDGTEMALIVKSVTKQTSGVYLIEFSAALGYDLLGSATNYRVSYTTKLSDICTGSDSDVSLDMSSFNVIVGSSTLTYGTDYTINKDLSKIVLIKAGQYSQYMDVDLTDNANPVNLSPDVVVSYKYTMTPREPVYKYSTYVTCSVETDIIIKPFSSDEVAQGNYHSINGTDVSQLNSFTLPIGESYIETTQPYSSVNDYDINKITGSPCSAAVIIPETIDSMCAYKDNMRQISQFILGTLNKSDGAKCFSFDSGKLLINFQPDFVDPVAFSDDTQASQEGTYFTCKRPTYDSSYINREYSSQPEIFELGFSYRSSTDRYVSVRIEVECDSPDSYVSVSRIGLNKLKED